MNNKIQILHLEDNANDIEIINELLKNNGVNSELTSVDNQSDFKNKIEKENFDLILADYTLPAFDGMKALKIAKEIKPEIPFIFVSGTIGVERAVEAIVQGAVDYVLKDNLKALVPAIRRALGEVDNRNKREEAEEALRESEKKYRTLVESTSDFIFMLDNKYCFMAANKSFCRATGLEEEQLIGKSADELDFDVDFISKWRRLCDTVLKTGKEVYSEIRSFVPKDDDKVFEIFLHPVISREGRVTAIRGISRDISIRKKTELELIRAKEKAEELNELKSNFLANMSHELRTPMNSILGFAELIPEISDKPEIRNFANFIHRSGRRLMETLNLILDLTKIETGMLQIVYSPVDVKELINDIVNYFEPVAKEKKIELKVVMKKEEITAVLERQMLYEIIYNLVNNAIKFTDSGEVRVEADFESSLEGDYLNIKVTDTGIGIPENKRTVIFDEFRQVSEGIHRSFEGTGLGLSITKKFVEKMFGTITVDSRLGKGTTFSLQLPSRVTGDRTNNTKDDGHVLSEFNFNGAKILNVLSVENDDLNRQLLSYMLAEVCNLDAVSSGEDAILAAISKRYDLILMDINLGKINGLDVIKEIRKLPDYINIPIAAVTAFTMKGDKEEFLSKGCDYFIPKPYSKSELLNIINDVSEKHK